MSPMIPFYLFMVFLVGAVCGHYLGVKGGAIALGAFLLLILAWATNEYGVAAFMIGVYWSSPIALIGAVGMFLGIEFRRRN